MALTVDAGFKDHRREGALFGRRTLIAALLVVVCLALVAARLTKLQVLEHDHFSTLSEDNRIKIQPLPPSRGLIYDRNGVLLSRRRRSRTWTRPWPNSPASCRSATTTGSASGACCQSGDASRACRSGST
jgi:hypothetical protein